MECRWLPRNIRTSTYCCSHDTANIQYEYRRIIAKHAPSSGNPRLLLMPISNYYSIGTSSTHYQERISKEIRQKWHRFAGDILLQNRVVSAHEILILRILVI